MEVDGAGSVSCPVVGFGIRGAESLGSVNVVSNKNWREPIGFQEVPSLS